MENIEERWCIVANIKQEIPFGPGGIESKSGIKKFKAGAKVSIVGSYAGTCTSIIAIGQERHSGKFINCVIRADKIENLRVKRIYRPETLLFLENYQPNGAVMLKTKQEAEELCSVIPRWVENL